MFHPVLTTRICSANLVASSSHVGRSDLGPTQACLWRGRSPPAPTFGHNCQSRPNRFDPPQCPPTD